MPASNYYRALMKSMLMIGFFLPVIPMTLVSGVMFYQFHRAYNHHVNAHFVEMVQKGRQTIDNLLKRNLDDLRFVSKTFDVEKLCKEPFLKRVLDAMQMQGGSDVSDLSVINDKGGRVAYAGPDELRKVSNSNGERPQEAAIGNHVGNYIIADDNGLFRFTLVVHRDWSEQRWMLKATIKPEALKEAIAALRPKETGSVYILNRAGQFLAQTDSDAISGKSLIKDFLRRNEAEKEKVAVIQRIDGFGHKHIYGTTPLMRGDGFLVYGQRVSEVFSSLNRAKTIALIVFIIIVLCLAANAYSLSRKMVARMEEADRQKQKMNEQMFQTKKLASIGELALGVAHEINNPVAIMVEEAGWVGDLLKEEEFREGNNLGEMRRALNQIRTQGMRCRDISYKLLSFARKTGSKVQEIRIRELIEDSIAVAAKTADNKNFVVEKQFQEDLPLLTAPRTELQQVLVNLIHNAIDAMENQNGILTLSASRKNNQVVLDVSDNGPGISRENLAKIFDPFFTTKPVGKGTGLGLSICYGIIKELGGEITVNSEIGAGSTFHVVLPI